jgi:hypothetical protein
LRLLAAPAFLRRGFGIDDRTFELFSHAGCRAIGIPYR